VLPHFLRGERYLCATQVAILAREENLSFLRILAMWFSTGARSRVYASGTVLDQMRPAATSTSHSADQIRRSAAHRDLCSFENVRSATIGGRHPA
jgi:hypothetical protein